ncbi:TPA: hypothetical protein MH334_24515 [Klebsiella pneumoniae]|nr:hypothetical protein B6I84_17430 [Klebsiella pneumoniae]HBX4929995.1 hypothetical protein [Klebsiella pneumoniae]
MVVCVYRYEVNILLLQIIKLQIISRLEYKALGSHHVMFGMELLWKDVSNAQLLETLSTIVGKVAFIAVVMVLQALIYLL